MIEAQWRCITCFFSELCSSSTPRPPQLLVDFMCPSENVSTITSPWFLHQSDCCPLQLCLCGLLSQCGYTLCAFHVKFVMPWLGGWVASPSCYQWIIEESQKGNWEGQETERKGSETEQEREGHKCIRSNSEQIGCGKWQLITILNILSKSNLLRSCHRPDICTLLGRLPYILRSQTLWASIYL